jgi:hypothetical protein
MFSTVPELFGAVSICAENVNSLANRVQDIRCHGEVLQREDECQPYYQVVIAAGSHLFPFRTEKLSPPAPMVLHSNAGE